MLRWVARLKVFASMVLVFSLLLNVSLPKTTNGQAIKNNPNNYQVSNDSNDPRNRVALKQFRQDATVAQLVTEAVGKGHSFKFDQPQFVKVGQGKGGDWTAVAIAGTRGNKEAVLVTGYYNHVTGEIEYAGAIYMKAGDKEKDNVLLESVRYDHGKLTRQATATYDRNKDKWFDGSGRMIEDPGTQTLGLTFGASASALCYYDFVCNMFYGTIAVLLCTLVGFAGVLPGIICGLVMLPLVYMVCYNETKGGTICGTP